MDLSDLPSVKKAAEEFKRYVSDPVVIEYCTSFIMNAQPLTCMMSSHETPARPDEQSVGICTAQVFLSGSNDGLLLSSSGVTVPPREMVTTQVMTYSFGTNVLGHYLLTNSLLPTIQPTAKATGLPVCVVEVSSSTSNHRRTGRLGRE
jgi:NAD(P)-dependent dehydrogenase (short-subunit alcohol dehydrogenase family)